MLTFSTTLRDLGFSPERQHIAIDAFQKDGHDDVGRVQLEKAGLDGYVDIRESLSGYELARLAETEKRVGLMHIDGSHQFEDVFCDFYFYRTLLEPGGYSLFDDSSGIEVAQVIRFIHRIFRLILSSFPCGNTAMSIFFEKRCYGSLKSSTRLS